LHGRAGDIATNRGAAEAAALPAEARHDALDEPASLRVVEVAEPERVEEGDAPGAHREDVSENAADAGGRALERLDERWVVVALDLEDDGPAVADVDRPRVFSRPLQHTGAFGGKPAQIDPRVLVGAVLRPERREEPELGVGRLAAEAARDPSVFFGGERRGPLDVQPH